MGMLALQTEALRLFKIHFGGLTLKVAILPVILRKEGNKIRNMPVEIADRNTRKGEGCLILSLLLLTMKMSTYSPLLNDLFFLFSTDIIIQFNLIQ